MRYSFASLIFLASTALAIPQIEKRDGIYTKVVTKTVTEVVYEPTSTPCTQKPKSTPPPVNKPVYKPPKTTHVVVYDPPAPTSTYKPKPKPQPTYKPQPGLDDFARSALDTHNKYRAQHSAPALEWDSDMANFASDWTSHCNFHHTDSSYGENIAAGYATIEAAIKAWYDEISDYDWGHPGFSEGAGHFTQVVWIGAKKLGCGCHTCDGQNGTPGIYYSCNYDTGNVDGQFGDNVK